MTDIYERYGVHTLKSWVPSGTHHVGPNEQAHCECGWSGPVRSMDRQGKSWDMWNPDPGSALYDWAMHHAEAYPGISGYREFAAQQGSA